MFGSMHTYTSVLDRSLDAARAERTAVSVVGTGPMGRALAARLAEAGAEVRLGTRSLDTVRCEAPPGVSIVTNKVACWWHHGSVCHGVVQTTSLPPAPCHAMAAHWSVTHTAAGGHEGGPGGHPRHPQPVPDQPRRPLGAQARHRGGRLQVKVLSIGEGVAFKHKQFNQLCCGQLCQGGFTLLIGTFKRRMHSLRHLRKCENYY